MRSNGRFAVLAVLAVLLVVLSAFTHPYSPPSAGNKGGDEKDEEDPLLPPFLENAPQSVIDAYKNFKPEPMAAVSKVPVLGKWQTKTPMPLERCDTPNGAVGIEISDEIYEFGGEDYNSSYDINLKYNTGADEWSIRAPMLSKREEFAVGVWKGNLYAICGHFWTMGNGTGSLDKNEMYDPKNNTWTVKAPCPRPRTWPAAATYNNRIYVMGGWNLPTGENFDYNDVYDPVNDTWSTASPMPTKVSGHATAVVNGKIYVIGGWDGISPKKLNQMYDPATDTWTQKAIPPQPISHFAIGVIDNKIYCIGGNFGGACNLTQVYVPAENKWYMDAPMPTVREEVGACVVSNKIYVIGGWHVRDWLYPECLGVNEVFTPAMLTVLVRASPNPTMSRYPTAVTVQVKDSTALISNASVFINDGGAGGTFTPIVNAGGGNYTCTYTPAYYSQETNVFLNASASAWGYSMRTGTCILTVRPPPPMIVYASVSPDEIYSKNATTLTVNAIDGPTGSPVTGAAVSFSDSSSGGSFTAAAEGAAGVYTSTYTAPTVYKQESLILTATVKKSGYPDTSGTAVLTINPAPVPPKPSLSVSASVSPSTVSSGGQATLTVTVTSGGTGVAGASLALSDGAQGGSFSVPSDLGGGTYSSTYTAPVTASNKTVTLRANATKTGYNPAEATASLSINNVPSLLVTAVASDAYPESYETVTINITVKDAAGAGVSGCAVTAQDNSAGGTVGLVSDLGSGLYSTTYACPPVQSTSTVQITVGAKKGGFNDGSGVCYLTLGPRPLSVSVTPAQPAVVSGGSVQVTALAYNPAANVDGATVAFEDQGAGGSFSSVANTGSGQYATTYTAPAVTAETTVTIIASASKNGWQDAQGSCQVTVTLAAPKILTAVFAPSASVLQSGGTAEVAIVVNESAAPVAGVSVSLSSGGTGSFSPVSGSTDASGIFSSTYNAPDTTSFANVTLAASFSKSGYVGSDATCAVFVTPAMPDFAVSASDISVSQAGAGAAKATITVRNIGMKSASGVGYRISVDGKLYGGDRQLQSVPAQGQAVATMDIDSLTAGSHTLSVAVDPANEFLESSEANNGASKAFQVADKSGGGELPIGTLAIPLIIVAVIVVVLVLALLLGKRRKKKEEPPKFINYQGAGAYGPGPDYGYGR